MSAAGIMIDQRTAADLLQWHGGIGTATYLVGSRAYSGHTVKADDIAECVKELRRCASYLRVSIPRPKDYDAGLAMLSGMIDALNLKLAL